MTCGTNWVKSMILPNFIEVLKVFEVTQGFTEYCTKFHKVIFHSVTIKLYVIVLPLLKYIFHCETS